MRIYEMLSAGSLLFIFLGSGQVAFAHCQIPCGIYDDHARYQSMVEDSATIEKATNQIIEISELLHADQANRSVAVSYNQLVRWVTNKENHADNIITVITNYFLTQRIKSGQQDYLDRLSKHHTVIVAAMKVKQNASLAASADLTAAIQALGPYYPKHEH